MSQQVSEQNVQCDSSRETLKVTLLGGGWSSSAGGLATLNRELAIQLSQHPKVEVSFLMPDGHYTEEDKREAQSYGIKVVGAKKRPGYEPLDWLSAPPEGHKMDVVVGHGAKLGRQVQFIKDSARFQNCKWVQVVHTAPEDLSKYKGYSDPISKGEKKHEVEVDLCKLANLVVPVGHRLEEAYSSYLQRSKRDIYPVVPGLFDRDFGDILQSPNENAEFKVLLCGRGDEEDFELKGYSIAVKAFTDHRLQRKSYHLIFVGAAEGKQEEVRERFLQCGIAEEQLTVRKFVKSRERIKDLLCEVSLAIMPSRSEGFGLVALEALSAGLPILVNSKSGFARALENIPFGESCIVDSDKPAKWAKAIERVRNRHKGRLEEIKLLRASYDKQYSWLKQCENFLEKLRTMIHGPSNGSVQIPRAEFPVQQQSAAAALHKGLSEQKSLPDEEKRGTGTVEEGEPSGLYPNENVKEPRVEFPVEQPSPAITTDTVYEPPKRKRVPRKEKKTPDTVIKLLISTRGLNEDQQKKVYNMLALQAQEYVSSRNFTEAELERVGALVEHLINVFNVSLVSVNVGSLEITVRCPTLESLERLWSDYLSGHLNEVVEKYLVTDELKRKLNLEVVRFHTTIEEENYVRCKRSFLEMSGKQLAGDDDANNGDDEGKNEEMEVVYDGANDNAGKEISEGGERLPQQLREIQLEEQQLLTEEEANKIRVYRGTVRREGTQWDLKVGAVHLTFPPDAVTEPTSIEVYKWKSSACSPNLQEHEAIVSNVIEISAYTNEALKFNVGVKLAISHSAPGLQGYELVMKRLINKEINEWEEVDGTVDARQLSDIEDEYPSPEDVRDFSFPLLQADIDECSIYTVICRLIPSPTYTISSMGGCFYHPDYPGVTVTVPENAVSAEAKFPLQLKVQEVPNADNFEGRNVYAGPILRISCPEGIEFLKPVKIQLPFALRVEEGRIPDPSICRVRVLFLRSDGENKEWIEITDDLETPALFDGTSVTFQVKRFSRYTYFITRNTEEHNIVPPCTTSFPPMLANFFAYFRPSERLRSLDILHLVCCPIHLRWEVKQELERDGISAHEVYEVSSGKAMIPRHHQAFVFVSGGISPVNPEYMGEVYLMLDTNCQFRKQLPIRLISDQVYSVVEFRYFAQLQFRWPSRQLQCETSPGFLRVKMGNPTKDDLLSLAREIGDEWKELGRRLDFDDAVIIGFHRENEKYREKAYAMLLKWKQQGGSKGATYQILKEALCHQLVGRTDLAEKICCC